MVLTRRMAKERATGHINGETNTSNTGPATQVGNTNSSLCSVAVICRDAEGANANNRASSRRRGTEANGTPKPTIPRENSTFEARTPAASRTSGAAKRKSRRKETPSKAVIKSGGLSPSTPAYPPDENANSPPGDMELRRRKRRRKDEGDSNKENADAVAGRNTPLRQRDEISTKPANKNLPEIVVALSSRSLSHQDSSGMEASDDVVFAYELLKLSCQGRKQIDVSPSPTAVLPRSPEKKSMSTAMTAVDNGVVRRLLELFDLKKAEDRTRQPGVTNT